MSRTIVPVGLLFFYYISYNSPIATAQYQSIYDIEETKIFEIIQDEVEPICGPSQYVFTPECLPVEIPLVDSSTIAVPEVAVTSTLYTPYQTAMWFLKSNESYLPRAKWDHKQFTSGWGTKASYLGEYISRQDADQRVVRHFNNVYQNVINDYPNLVEDRFVALIVAQFLYNCGSPGNGLKNALRNFDANDNTTLDNLISVMGRYVHASGVRQPGLVIRRQQEAILLRATPLERQMLTNKYREKVDKLYQQATR